MIFDRMERLTQYRGLNANLDRLIDFALDCDVETLVPGMFAIFFPGDAHNCGISKAGQTQVRKLVGKAKC